MSLMEGLPFRTPPVIPLSFSSVNQFGKTGEISSIISVRSGSTNKLRKSKLSSVFPGSISISSSHRELVILIASSLLTLGVSLIFNTLTDNLIVELEPNWSIALRNIFWLPIICFVCGFITNKELLILHKFANSFSQLVPSLLTWKERESPCFISISSNIFPKLNKLELLRLIDFSYSLLFSSEISVHPLGILRKKGFWFTLPISNLTSCSICPPKGSFALIFKV